MNNKLRRLFPGQKPDAAQAPSPAVAAAAAALIAAAAEEEAEAEDSSEETSAEDTGAEDTGAGDESASGEDTSAGGEDAQDDDEEEEREDEEEQPMASESADAQAARRRERGRIASVLGSDQAKGREATARHLALNSDMTAAEAIAMLETVPKGSARGSLGERMAGQRQPNVGPGGGQAAAGTVEATADRLLGYVKGVQSAA